MKKYTFLLLFSLFAFGSKAQTAQCGSSVNWDSVRITQPEVYREHLRIEQHTQAFINSARNLQGGGDSA